MKFTIIILQKINSFTWSSLLTSPTYTYKLFLNSA